MKINDVKNTIAGIAIAVGIFAFMWFCTSRNSETTTAVPETELSIVKFERTIYGSEEDVTYTYYFLLNDKGDTLSWKSQERDPFVNARGVVYMPQKGIYDCRGKEVRCILPLKDYSSRVEIIDDGDKVQIFLGRPSVDVTKLGLPAPKAKHYTYDLKTKQLSSE